MDYLGLIVMNSPQERHFRVEFMFPVSETVWRSFKAPLTLEVVVVAEAGMPKLAHLTFLQWLT